MTQIVLLRNLILQSCLGGSVIQISAAFSDVFPTTPCADGRLPKPLRNLRHSTKVTQVLFLNPIIMFYIRCTAAFAEICWRRHQYCIRDACMVDCLLERSPFRRMEMYQNLTDVSPSAAFIEPCHRHPTEMR
jgi:hypothetical protein